MTSWDPSKHPRKPAGSDQGGEFTRAADRSAGAQMSRMDKAHADAQKHAHKLGRGRSEEEIATEAGYPPGHEQHWAFRNGLVQAAQQLAPLQTYHIGLMQGKRESISGYHDRTYNNLVSKAEKIASQSRKAEKQGLTELHSTLRAQHSRITGIMDRIVPRNNDSVVKQYFNKIPRILKQR